MKKFIIFISAIIMAMSSFATDQYPTKSNVEVNSFWSNWFLGVDGGAQVGVGNNGFVWNSVTPGVSVELGKWVTPVVGLRGLINAGHYSTLVKANYTTNEQLGGAAFFDLMFNLSNVKYTDNKVWNFIPYIGFGRVASQEDYKNFGRWAWNLGLDNKFAVSKHVSLDLDLFANRHNGYGAAGAYNAVPGRNWNVGAMFGVTFNLGKTDWNHAADIVAVEAVYQAKVEAYEEISNKALDRLQECWEEKGKVDTVYVTETKVVETPMEHSVFFGADSYVPESQKDLRNLNVFIEYAKNNPDAVVNVVGYADSKTGSKEYNQKLSSKRADAVAKYLVEHGLSDTQVNAFGLGGSEELNPYNYNRRVLVVLQ